MPVGRMGLGDGPRGALRVKAVLDVEVFVNVLVVVAVDETVPSGLHKDGDGAQYQQPADGNHHSPARPVAAGLEGLHSRFPAGGER